MNTLGKHFAIGALLVLSLAVLPALITERYLLGEVVVFMIWAVVATHWNVLTGYAGVFSLGQMLFFACGAYAMAMLSHYYDVSPWIGMPIGGVIAASVAFFIGLACLRLSTAYVALLTLAVAYMVYTLIITESGCISNEGGRCQRLFGGTTGFSRIEDFGFRPLLRGNWILGNYYVVLAAFAISISAALVIIHGRLGLAFRALDDSSAYAAARGLNRVRYRLIAFVVTAFFTGFIGAVQAIHFRAAGPSLFDFSTLLFVLSMVIVGGLRTTWGPVLGAALMMILLEVGKSVGDIRNTLIGLSLVLVVVLMPGGLMGLIETLFGRLWTRTKKEG